MKLRKLYYLHITVIIHSCQFLLIIIWLMVSIPSFGDDHISYKADTTIFYKHGITIQWIGIVFHPQGGTYPERYIRKLDPQAYFVIELGAILSYEYQVFERAFVKAGAAFNLDCANVPAGFFHIGGYYQVINRKRHILSIGLGPTLVYRENWGQFPEYTGDEFFKDNLYHKWQYRFVIFGSFEYNFRLTNRLLLNTSLIPGGHLVMTFSFGLKYIIP